jgi:hypothetical protein
MPSVNGFLQSVEARLRCPQERRPALIEELRGHLAERAEALMQTGIDRAEAEKTAVREMAPAWLLAFRLSRANGWSVPAHVLRELAAGMAGLWVVVAAGNSGLADYGAGWVVTPWLTVPLLLGLFAAFGYSAGRTVRGWLWSLGLAGLVIVLTGAWHELWQLGIVAALVVLVISAVVGSRRESPRLMWLAWLSGGFSIFWWFAWAGAQRVMFARSEGLAQGMAETALATLVTGPRIGLVWVLVALPVLLGALAWGLQAAKNHETKVGE